jgi:hypothetical protein
METISSEAGGTMFKMALVGTSNLMLYKEVVKLNMKEFGKMAITSKRRKYLQTSDSIK